MSLTYDGHDLESLFACGDPEITILNSIPDAESPSGRDGSIVIGRRWGDASVSFAIGASGTAAQRRAAFSTLGAWLTVDGPRQLVLPDTPDRYYLAIPDGPLDLKRGIMGEMARLTFTLTDPIAYGQQRTANIPSGGSVSITVGGTAPAKPTITASAAVRDSSSEVWGVRLDSGKVLHIATGSSSARAVSIDCDARTSTVAGAIALPTLDSDWFEMAPGSHTIAMNRGTGAATITWRERWY